MWVAVCPPCGGWGAPWCIRPQLDSCVRPTLCVEHGSVRHVGSSGTAKLNVNNRGLQWLR